MVYMPVTADELNLSIRSRHDVGLPLGGVGLTCALSVEIDAVAVAAATFMFDDSVAMDAWREKTELLTC